MVVALAVAGTLPVTAPAAAAECVGPARTVVPELPWAQQWLQPQRIWPLTQGAGVTVAVVDSGVDGQVRQLRGRVEAGLDVLAGGGRADTDCSGHGTFAAGIVAAAEQPGVGFAGLAPQARVLPLRVTTDTDELPPAAATAAAVRTAAERGARVILVGTPIVRAGAELRAALTVAQSRDALVIVVPWAGADSPAPVDPWVAERVVSVGGFGLDGAAMTGTAAPVDLVAPGSALVSVGPRGPGHLLSEGNGYAAAFVAGAAALVRARHPRLTAAQVKQRLLATSDRVPRQVPDPALGYGCLDLYAAVTAVLPGEHGTGLSAAPVPRAVVARPGQADDQAFRTAAVAVAVAGVLALLATVVALAVPRIRRRQGLPR
ncbi:S8 family serine peptidase [Catellatospora coxensis]|uniref:Peptidase S8 n=1 Tax=Catellatospora coxensis TaxID=310354 RepID=A0A8J3PAB8_9ACTN|nr:peptidase S8 [Catellatospora coxensis]